jgi:hypothetical protein
MEGHGGMILTGENRKNRREPYPRVTLSTMKLTWTDRGAIPGLRDERPTANCLSHGTKLCQPCLLVISRRVRTVTVECSLLASVHEKVASHTTSQ